MSSGTLCTIDTVAVDRGTCCPPFLLRSLQTREGTPCQTPGTHPLAAQRTRGAGPKRPTPTPEPGLAGAGSPPAASCPSAACGLRAGGRVLPERSPRSPEMSSDGRTET